MNTIAKRTAQIENGTYARSPGSITVVFKVVTLTMLKWDKSFRGIYKYPPVTYPDEHGNVWHSGSVGPPDEHEQDTEDTDG